MTDSKDTDSFRQAQSKATQNIEKPSKLSTLELSPSTENASKQRYEEGAEEISMES